MYVYATKKLHGKQERSRVSEPFTDNCEYTGAYEDHSGETNRDQEEISIHNVFLMELIIKLVI